MCKVNPKIDLVFKKLFGVDKNKDLLISLINSMLSVEDQIKSIILKNPYNLPDYLDGKLSVLDIKAEDEKGRYYNIEMQIIGHDDYGLRTLFYLAKAFIEQIGAGGKYKDLNKTIVINIVDFEFFAEEVENVDGKSKEKRYHREIAFRDVKTLEKYAQLDYFSVHFVELPKYNDNIKVKNTTDSTELSKQNVEKLKVKSALERWITFLNNAGELNKDNLPSDLATEEIKKAVEELTIMYFDDKEKAYYERQQILLMDEHSRLESAEHKKALAIAKEMLNDGESVEKIIKYTKLEKDEINRLKTIE